MKINKLYIKYKEQIAIIILITKIVAIILIVNFIIMISSKWTQHPFIPKPIIIKENPIIKYDTINITVSVYQATIKQCDKDYLTTGSGRKIQEKNIMKDRIIALSQDFFFRTKLHYGDSVLILGTKSFDGWYIVEDAMNKRLSKTVDILIPKSQQGNLWKDCKLIYKK